MPRLEASLPTSGLILRPAEDLMRDPAVGPDTPTVLIVDQSLLEDSEVLDSLPEKVVIVAADAAAEEALGDAADLSLAFVTEEKARLRVLRTAFQLSAARCNQSRILQELAELNRIGMSLMAERDRDALLHQILEQVMRLTTSDAGALYLLEHEEDGSQHLRFKLVLVESVEPSTLFEEIEIPLDSTSFPGHVAVTKEPLVVDDIRNLPKDASYSLNPFAERRGYWIKPMLTIPMVDNRGEVVGVLQVANRKAAPEDRIVSKEDSEQYTLPYTAREVAFGRSLAGQAAMLIENANLYRQIDELFECFVKASVTAIDQRDPSTAGHSLRVATLVTDLAHAIERSGSGSYRNTRFSRAQIRELRYAALLHDFGKVGVSESVLMKAKKLPPLIGERVDARFDLIRCSLELQYERKRARLRQTGGDHARSALDAEFNQQLAQLERFRSAVWTANKPALLPEEAAGVLNEIARQTFERPDGRIVPYLEPEELRYLQIPKGSLDESERREVESHATQTFEFLSGIKWTDDLKDIATYASSHYEKLDGTGYPRHLRGTSLPVQTRILAIADIFDALTAADRPYKAAVSTERALDIIRAEAVAGQLDREIADIMIESGVYRRVLGQDWHQF